MHQSLASREYRGARLLHLLQWEHSGSIQQEMAGSELPAGGVNIQSVSGDSVIRMFYESPFFFFFLLKINLRSREQSRQEYFILILQMERWRQMWIRHLPKISQEVLCSQISSLDCLFLTNIIVLTTRRQGRL